MDSLSSAQAGPVLPSQPNTPAIDTSGLVAPVVQPTIAEPQLAGAAAAPTAAALHTFMQPQEMPPQVLNLKADEQAPANDEPATPELPSTEQPVVTPEVPAPDLTPAPSASAAPAATGAPEPGQKSPKVFFTTLKVILVIVIVLAIIAIVGGYYWYSHRTPTPAAPATTNQAITNVTQLRAGSLAQTDSDGSLATGATTQSSKLTFSAAEPATTNDNIKLEVEAEPIGTAFSNKPSASTAATNNNTLQAVVSNLAAGSYHWQARISDGTNNGPWGPYGGNDESVADFIVNSATAAASDTSPSPAATSAPAAVTITTVSGTPISAGKASVTSNQPSFSGTAAAAASITLKSEPDGFAITTTADANGAWTAAFVSDVPNGDHTVTVTATSGSDSSTANLALSVNAATAAADAPLAPTGDPSYALYGILLIGVAGLGLVASRRYGSPKI